MLLTQQLMLRSLHLLDHTCAPPGWIPCCCKPRCTLHSGDRGDVLSCFALVACELSLWVVVKCRSAAETVFFCRQLEYFRNREVDVCACAKCLCVHLCVRVQGCLYGCVCGCSKCLFEGRLCVCESVCVCLQVMWSEYASTWQHCNTQNEMWVSN